MSCLVACVGVALFAVFFSQAPAVAADGTVASGGIGRALEILVVGAVIYISALFVVSRRFGLVEDQ